MIKIVNKVGRRGRVIQSVYPWYIKWFIRKEEFVYVIQAGWRNRVFDYDSACVVRV